jgi:hypothetical protein
MDLLRKEVENHVNREHACATDQHYALEIMNKIMRGAEYHSGSNEPEVSTATAKPPIGTEPKSIWKDRIPVAKEPTTTEVFHAATCPSCNETFVTHGTVRDEPEVSKASIAPTKPPLGIEPEHRWRGARMYDLIDCISRHRTTRFPAHDEWLWELKRLLDRHLTNT